MTWWREWFKRKAHQLASTTPKAARKTRAARNREDHYPVRPGSGRGCRGEGDAEKMHNSSYKLFRLELYERAWELRIRPLGSSNKVLFPNGRGAISLVEHFDPSFRFRRIASERSCG